MNKDELLFLRNKLKSGEYDGTDIMQAWLAIDRLIESDDRIALLEAAIRRHKSSFTNAYDYTVEDIELWEVLQEDKP